MPTTTTEEKSNQTEVKGSAPVDSTPADTPAKPAKRKKPVVAIVIGIVVLVAIGIYGLNFYRFNTTHASTDDATIAAGSVSVSPQISGTVVKVLVNDNQAVKKGDLLAVLDDRTLKSSVAQAQANLDAAVAAAQSAGAQVSLARQSGAAQIQQAQGIEGQAQSGISSAQSDVLKATAGIDSASAMRLSSAAGLASAKSGVTNAKAALQRAISAVTAAQAVVASAQAQVKVSDANVVTAQANYNLAAKDAQRFSSLVAQGAVSQQEADVKNNAAQAASAALDSAKQQAASSRAMVNQQLANVQTAKGQVTSARAQINQAQSQVQVAQSTISSSQASYLAAIAQKSAAEQSVSAAQSKAEQAQGQMSQAQTAPAQLSSSQAAKAQALAKVEQARAELMQADLNLSYTRIYAPESGKVTEKNLDVGQLVSPNAPLMSLVNNSEAYIWANYKETQMQGIAVGEKVDIQVDAFPGRDFTGKVQSIQAGTGSSFTLIPPDNASGNFTKVVQRIPIKIVFDPNQPGLDQLVTGMMATTIIDISK